MVVPDKVVFTPTVLIVKSKVTTESQFSALVNVCVAVLLELIYVLPSIQT